MSCASHAGTQFCARHVAARTPCRRFSLRRRGFSRRRGFDAPEHGRQSPSDLHQCLVHDLDHRPPDQHASTNTSSPTDRGPIVLSCDACGRFKAVQRICIAAVWLCWQSLFGSFNSYFPRRMAAHEARTELFRRRLPAGTIRGAHDPSGPCIRESLLPRRRDPSVLVLQLTILQDVPQVSDERESGLRIISDPPWKAERQLVALLAHVARIPRDLVRFRFHPHSAREQHVLCWFFNLKSVCVVPASGS